MPTTTLYSLRTALNGGLNDSGSVRGRLSYSGRQGDGYVDAIGFARDAFDTDRHSARGQLEIDLGESTLLRLSGDYTSVREGMWGMESSGQAIAQKHPTIPIARTPGAFDETFNLNGYQRADVWGGSVRIEHDFGGATFTSLTGVRGDELDELTDFDASAADAIGRQFAEESDSFQQELRLASGSDSRVTWLAGLYYFTEEVDRLGQFFLGAHNTFVIGLGPFPGNGGVPFSNLDTRTIETDSWAAFGQLTIPLGERFNVTLGGRYTEDEKSMRRSAQTVGATDLVNPFLEQAFEVEVAADWNSFDPAFILDYHFNDDHMAYASYRQGYKSGGFQTDPVINAAAAAVVFNPEEVRSTEIGYKANAFDGRLQLNAAAHRSTYDNLQFLGTVALEQRRVRLADRQRRARGSEGSRARLRSPARARPDVARKLRLSRFDIRAICFTDRRQPCRRTDQSLAGELLRGRQLATSWTCRAAAISNSRPRARIRTTSCSRPRTPHRTTRARPTRSTTRGLSYQSADSSLASHVVGQESHGRSVQDTQPDDRRDPHAAGRRRDGHLCAAADLWCGSHVEVRRLAGSSADLSEPSMSSAPRRTASFLRPSRNRSTSVAPRVATISFSVDCRTYLTLAMNLRPLAVK